MSNPWPLLRSGKVKQGLAISKEWFAQNQSPSHTMELGVAYLFTKKYKDAYAHFRRGWQSCPAGSRALYFGMAGVAKWCLNDRQMAVAEWRNGLKVDYADGAGGVRNPLLLFTASVMEPSLISREEVQDILRERLQAYRCRETGRAVGKFRSGGGKGRDLPGLMEGLNPGDTENRRWQVRFYQGILELACNRRSRFSQIMKEVSDLNNIDEDAMLSRLWCEEYFIARHESA